MKNGPPIFTSHFSGCGGVHAVEYFCADQFEAAGVFPTGREISLAAGGVLIDKEKASGFPVLSSLFEEPSTIARHQRMSEEVARVSAPILFNLSNQTVFPCPDGTALDIIRRFTLLKGYTKPYFVRHTRDFAEVCPLKPKEQGLVLNSSRAYGMGLDSRLGECVFNVEQFEEPQCVEELIVKTPTNFPNQSPFRGVRCALACARAQRAKSGFSHLWIPATFLSYLDGKWPLLPGATRVEWGMYLSTLMPALYNVSDVEVPPNALEWWPTYVPHDALHRPLTGAARGVVSLRAWERGYKSPMWMTHVMMTRFGAKLKPVGRKRSYLRGDPFGESRGVVIGNRKYFNIEEVENVDQFLTNLRNTGTSN
ncbi:unnamed protein product [Trypanosoma congolense IL3000]|uniref:WGS project CAEQ00000000 data, annotated contig 539 n=1 Tax=Trypanosoma congolense (strain IL3000) TaxID=1068625 RepID=F9WGS5_TRYCI|nr:unnamed protein product [Trypanosoma congolense IL3000]